MNTSRNYINLAETFKSQFHPAYSEAQIGDLLLFEPLQLGEKGYTTTYDWFPEITSFRLITGIEKSVRENLTDKYWIIILTHSVTLKGNPKKFLGEIQIHEKPLDLSHRKQRVSTIDSFSEVKDIWDAGYKVSPRLMKTILGNDLMNELWLMLQLLER